MFGILVEVWAAMTPEDEFDLDYAGEFLWADGFATGTTILFEDARTALGFLSENRMEDEIPGCEYRYRIVPLDNSDGAFNRDVNKWD